VQGCLQEANVNAVRGETTLDCLAKIATPDADRNPRRIKKIINHFVFRWHFIRSETPRADVLMLLAAMEGRWPILFGRTYALTEAVEYAP